MKRPVEPELDLMIKLGMAEVKQDGSGLTFNWGLIIVGAIGVILLGAVLVIDWGTIPEEFLGQMADLLIALVPLLIIVIVMSWAMKRVRL